MSCLCHGHRSGPPGAWRRAAAASALLASLAAAAAPPAPRPRAASAPPLESCVSRDAIGFAQGEPRAVLDGDDQAKLREAMMRRYPVVARDGFAVSRIILWQPAAGDALFITVQDHPTKPGRACFTATFTARRFDAFVPLRDKYLLGD
jgi:hypothetical protein